MISDMVLSVLSAVLGFLGNLLPTSVIPLPSISSVTAAFGKYTGPMDRFFPVKETVEFLVLVLSGWMPCAATYTITKWIYKHLPVVGKG